MIGLAVIAKRQNHLNEYYSRLCEIYRLEPTNYLLNIYLAEHYFYKGEFPRAKALCQQGLKNIDQHMLISKPERRMPPIRIDVCIIKSKYLYMLGFMAHENDEKYEQILSYYNAAVEQNPENCPALFGLGQIYLASVSGGEAEKLQRVAAEVREDRGAAE